MVLHPSPAFIAHNTLAWKSTLYSKHRSPHDYRLPDLVIVQYTSEYTFTLPSSLLKANAHTRANQPLSRPTIHTISALPWVTNWWLYKPSFAWHLFWRTPSSPHIFWKQLWFTFSLLSDWRDQRWRDALDLTCYKFYDQIHLQYGSALQCLQCILHFTWHNFTARRKMADVHKTHPHILNARWCLVYSEGIHFKQRSRVAFASPESQCTMAQAL